MQSNNDNDLGSSTYELFLDEDRFEEQFLGGQRGYYDKVEKVFVPLRAFDILFEEIGPQPSDNLPIHETRFIDDVTLERSRQRVELNLKEQYRRTNKDSYSQIFMAYLSRRFLLRYTDKGEDDMVILYVDLVGSTALSAIVASEELSTLVKTFCQEMSIVVSKYNGYVLKYAGDAVIGYFPRDPDISTACEEAVKCARVMKKVIDESINVIFAKYGFPKVKIRVAIDEGKNQVVILGQDPDLLGHIISRAAKFMGKAKPNEIVIGENVFSNLTDQSKRNFLGLQENFILAGTGEKYPVYLSSGS